MRLALPRYYRCRPLAPDLDSRRPGSSPRRSATHQSLVHARRPQPPHTLMRVNINVPSTSFVPSSVARPPPPRPRTSQRPHRRPLTIVTC